VRINNWFGSSDSGRPETSFFSFSQGGPRPSQNCRRPADTGEGKILKGPSDQQTENTCMKK